MSEDRQLLYLCTKLRILNMSNYYWEISLHCVPVEVHERVVMERLMEITERKVSAGWRGFREGKDCVD